MVQSTYNFTLPHVAMRVATLGLPSINMIFDVVFATRGMYLLVKHSL